MVLSIENGFLCATNPASVNCNTSITAVMAKISTIILANTPSTVATCPPTVIFKKMPKIYNGRSGIITATITWSIISLKSCMAPFRRLPLITAIPSPKVNANTRAVITSISGGMAIVKYGLSATACPKEVMRSAAVIIHG